MLVDLHLSELNLWFNVEIPDHIFQTLNQVVRPGRLADPNFIPKQFVFTYAGDSTPDLITYTGETTIGAYVVIEMIETGHFEVYAQLVYGQEQEVLETDLTTVHFD